MQADLGVQGAYYIDTLETGGVTADVFLGVAKQAGAGAPPGGIVSCLFPSNGVSGSVSLSPLYIKLWPC